MVASTGVTIRAAIALTRDTRVDARWSIAREKYTGGEPVAQENPCEQNCPQRSVLCHAGCEAYNEYHKQREAEMKRRAQKADEAGFYHEARQAVKRKHERKIRYDNR